MLESSALLQVVRPDPEWAVLVFLSGFDTDYETLLRRRLTKEYRNIVFVEQDEDVKQPWHDDAEAWLRRWCSRHHLLTVTIQQGYFDPYVLSAHFAAPADRDAFFAACVDGSIAGAAKDE